MNGVRFVARHFLDFVRCAIAGTGPSRYMGTVVIVVVVTLIAGGVFVLKFAAVVITLKFVVVELVHKRCASSSVRGGNGAFANFHAGHDSCLLVRSTVGS